MIEQGGGLTATKPDPSAANANQNIGGKGYELQPLLVGSSVL